MPLGWKTLDSRRLLPKLTKGDVARPNHWLACVRCSGIGGMSAFLLFRVGRLMSDNSKVRRRYYPRIPRGTGSCPDAIIVNRRCWVMACDCARRGRPEKRVGKECKVGRSGQQE